MLKKIDEINMANKDTSHINSLENEAIYIIREVAAQFEKPVLLFSGGKDSITLVRLAVKAFYPAKWQTMKMVSSICRI